MVSYNELLYYCGAEVLNYAEFGNSEGRWFAKVSFKGTTGWVTSTYGCCGNCDDLMAINNYPDSDKPESFFSLGNSILSEITSEQNIINSLNTDFSNKQNLTLDIEIINFIKENS